MPVPWLPSTKGMKIKKLNGYTYAKLVAYMLDGVFDCRELADLTGLHYVTVLDYTRELHRTGAAHISEFHQDARGADTIKVYKIGRGADAVRLKMTSAERTARYRAAKTLRDAQAVLTISGLTLITQLAPET